MASRWQFGDRITRRERLGFEPEGTGDRTTPWFGTSWLDLEARVVLDEPDELVLFVPRGAPMHFPDGIWPSETGVHPWSDRDTWQGPGCLMWHRPGEHHAVWHFWTDPDRDFLCWYVNLQTAYERSATTFDTQDLELDFVVFPDLTWVVKDWDAVPERVDDGRLSAAAGEWIHDHGRSIIDRLERSDIWWPQHWAEWQPPAEWEVPPSG